MEDGEATDGISNADRSNSTPRVSPVVGDASQGRRRYRCKSASLCLRPPQFVPLSEKDRRRALDALAELMVPLFTTVASDRPESGSERKDGPVVTRG